MTWIVKISQWTQTVLLFVKHSLPREKELGWVTVLIRYKKRLLFSAQINGEENHDLWCVFFTNSAKTPLYLNSIYALSYFNYGGSVRL